MTLIKKIQIQKTVKTQGAKLPTQPSPNPSSRKTSFIISPIHAHHQQPIGSMIYRHTILILDWLIRSHHAGQVNELYGTRAPF